MAFMAAVSWEDRPRRGPSSLNANLAACSQARRDARHAREVRSPRPSVTGVLRHIAVPGLLADVVFFVVAMAPGGVERNLGRAAGSLVALVVLGNRLDGFLRWLGHHPSPLTMRKRWARGCCSWDNWEAVIASEAKQSRKPRARKMDCFVASLL